MTAAERQQLAREIATELKEAHACQFSEEDRATLREFAQAIRKAKSTAFATLVTALVILVLGAAGIGLAAKIKAAMP